MSGKGSIVNVIAAIVLALISAFFVFYTVRLLAVTGMLTATRPGGGGAYAGAVVFPFVALVSGWGAWRCVARARGARPGA